MRSVNCTPDQRVMSSNTDWPSRKTWNLGYDQFMSLRAGFLPTAGAVMAMFISRLGSRYGNGRRSSASTALKMAVLAPMPTASVSTATAVKPGARRNERSAKRASCTSSSNSQKPAMRHSSSL